ncbi:DUF7948 domain-containing protein [Arthrobacter pascens]|uniref:DUF7948 domain-containing protein n=1 Tax=Arthrobacter pascens TaxID=1677 RepID=UPI00196AF294|nr:SBBP repeat-containing protein [Arthrobacter pascens]MBN3498140.1 SBBP repeat-containing protein [Arthrobacter pascens]
MSVGIACAREGSIGWDGVPGSRGGGRHWPGFIVGLVVLALLAVASVVVTPTALTPTAAGVAGGREAVPAGPAPAGLSPAGSGQALDAYGKLPLSFVPNAGQTDQSVRYYAQGSGFSFFFTQDKAVLSFAKGERGQALELHFLGSSPAASLETGNSAPGTVNYLTAGGSHTNLPTYQQLTYRELWPGIDMVFAGRDGSLKYEFHLAPGADPSNIRLGYSGANGLSLSPDGAMLIDTPLGALRDSSPTSYQTIDGNQAAVESRYALEGHSYGFALGSYDRSQALVIDPALAYSTFLGGTADDRGLGVAVDTAGNAYVTGVTTSTDFPTTAGAFDTAANGGADVFVTKLNPTGTALVYSTYLGGTSTDNGQAIAVDAMGNAYVTGQTTSSNFPTTPGAFDTAANGGVDAYVTKLNATGTGLVYSTYLGGGASDTGFGIAVDVAGSAHVTGTTPGFGFPTTLGAFDTSPSGGDAFVTKLNPTGAGLVYSTFVGGTSGEEAHAVALDVTGSAYVTGQTISSDFPTTAGASDTTLDGLDDAFVSKLDTTGSALIYSTYLGGSGGAGALEAGFGIAVDVSGAYVTGMTNSSDFPTTAGAFDTTLGGVEDGFVTKVNLAGSGLSYSTFLGGASSDRGEGIAVDTTGGAFVTGRTNSVGFPTTTGTFQTTYGGGANDAFLSKLNTTGTALADSTFLGSAADDRGLGIALDTAGSAYITGQTASLNFPTTPGAFDTTQNGSDDAFVAKFSFGPGAPATLTLAPAADTNDVGTQHCVTATVEDASGNPTPGITVRFSVTGSVNTSGSDTTDVNGEADFCYQGPELPGADAISAFADTDSDTAQDPGEPFAAASKVWTLPVTTPLCEANITKGGRITAANGDKATFGGNAQSNAAGNVKGQEQYQDHGPSQPLKVKSIKILALTCNPQRTQATIFGRATLNGQGSHLFRIDVQDLGEPGVGIDKYRILLGTGYDSGSQTLLGGNIQIH